MGFTTAFDDWYASRETRAEIPMGERNGLMEQELGGEMTPNQLFWFPWLHGDREAEAG